MGERGGDGTASACFFSSDNYGDRTVKETKGTKAIMKTDPRASCFLRVKTARDLSTKHWEEIFAAATEFLNASRARKRKRSQSASSHASSNYIEIPEYYTFVSIFQFHFNLSDVHGH